MLDRASMLRTKLVYGDNITITGGAGLGKQSFRLNGLYDPDFTGTGH